MNGRQMFTDPLAKGLPPSVYREHTVDMGLWYSLCFPDNKGPKVKVPISEPRGVLQLLSLSVIDRDDEACSYALIRDGVGKQRIKNVESKD